MILQKIKLTPTLSILICTLIMYSCNINQTSDFQNSDLEGNWFSKNKDFYQEFYFDGNEKMYEVNPYSGNVNKYLYRINQDTIYQALMYGDSVLNYEYFDFIEKRSLERIILKDKTLNKINDSILIENYVKEEIDENQLDQAIFKRLNNNGVDNK